MRNAKILRQLKMQPGDAAAYEAEARAYFDSLRQPFEQTLKATRRDYAKLLGWLAWLSAFIGLAAVPFVSTRVAAFIFGGHSFSLWGKTYEISETAGMTIASGFIGTMLFGGIFRLFYKDFEINAAKKPLSQHVMTFALSYAILRELESFEHSNLTHHHQTVIQLWAKLLTYSRWTLQYLTADVAHFHNVPRSPEYPLASYAEHFANRLHWKEVRTPEYRIITALNSLHSKISPRLKDGQDLPVLKDVFRALGNWFYTSLSQLPDNAGLVSWGYTELTKATDIVNNLPAISQAQGMTNRSAPLLFTGMFTHSNIVVAFFAWWIVFQTLFAVLISVGFHFWPSLSMNSQAMATIIGGPIAAAISMVGISRKGS